MKRVNPEAFRITPMEKPDFHKQGSAYQFNMGYNKAAEEINNKIDNILGQ